MSDPKTNESEQDSGSIYDFFETDGSLEQTGIWVNYGPRVGRFLVARAGGANDKFGRVMEQKLRPYRKQIEKGIIDPKVAEKLVAEALAETVILGWEGVRGRDKKEIKFTRAACVQLLTDLPQLAEDLRETATDWTHFRAAEDEFDSKNS